MQTQPYNATQSHNPATNQANTIKLPHGTVYFNSFESVQNRTIPSSIADRIPWHIFLEVPGSMKGGSHDQA